MIEPSPLINRAYRARLAHQLRILHVIAGAEFKLKYAGSTLGYVWSLVSLVVRESLLRKLSFPRVIIPTSATLTAAITFGINLIAIVAFIAWNRLVPRVDWLLILPLLLELYVFTLAIALILATVFVRLRDIGQIWELALQVFFYASPIVYPIGYLPPWARKIVFLNPFTQVLQDIRSIVLYPDLKPNRITAADAFGFAGGQIIPITIVALVAVVAVTLFRREEPYFAERV